MAIKVVSIAGTPVDTRMGVDFLREKDPSLEVYEYNMSANPVEQTMFQFGGEESKHARAEADRTAPHRPGRRDVRTAAERRAVKNGNTKGRLCGAVLLFMLFPAGSAETSAGSDAPRPRR